MSNLKDISDTQLIDYIKSSSSWNEIMKKCDIKTLTRSLQRRINHLDKNITSHLPKFYGGIYSKIAKHSDEYYKELIAKSENWDEVMSELKFTTLQIFKNVKEHLDKLNINYSHMKKPTLFRTNSRYSLEEILIENSSYTNMIQLKMRLIKEYDWKYECSGCNKSTYSNNWVSDVPIPLEIDHINGVHSDNRIENIRFLCPNCHSFTENYKGKNMQIAIQNKNADIKVNKKAYKNVKKIVSSVLDDIIKQIEKPTNKIKKCVDCNIDVSKRATRCGDCNYKLRFNNLGKKIDERPSLETLNRDIAELKNFSAVGRKHNVCDNTIRKWIKNYNKYA